MRKFYEIFQELEEKIKSNSFAIGDTLPSETALANSYDVSRETVRKALALLVENGYIQKQQGKSAIVIRAPRFKIAGNKLGSFSDWHQFTAEVETIVIKNKKERIPFTLASKYNLSEETLVIALQRIRKSNGEAVAYDTDYYLTDIIPDIPHEKAEDSIFEYIESDLGLKIAHAHKRLTIEPATDEDRILLAIGNDSHVGVIRSEVYLDDTRLFQFHVSRLRVDMVEFNDFARRKPKS